MKKFRGSALVAGAAAFALTISGCAAPEELTPTQSATSNPETTVEWYEDLAPQITVGWNDIVDHFNGSTAAGNNVANSLTAYLTARASTTTTAAQPSSRTPIMEPTRLWLKTH